MNSFDIDWDRDGKEEKMDIYLAISTGFLDPYKGIKTVQKTKSEHRA